MSDRERWIIYPLLFLALGVALRDKIFKTTASQRVQTESLLLTDGNGAVIASLENDRQRSRPVPKEGRLVVKQIEAQQIVLRDAQGRVVVLPNNLATVAAPLRVGPPGDSQSMRLLEALRRQFMNATRPPTDAPAPESPPEAPVENGTPPESAQPSEPADGGSHDESDSDNALEQPVPATDGS